ncbi:cell division protein ZapE [soil metagenome]
MNLDSAGETVSLDFREILTSLPPRPHTEALVGEFVPPARFAGKSFDSYSPRHPSQQAALARLRTEASLLISREREGMISRLRRRLSGRTGGGLYLDGGFGVGKTHLLAALWNAAPFPKSYLSFDELVYFIGLVGVREAGDAFSDQALIAVDEWELDDPGNLKLALAFLRDVVKNGVRLAVTSNTLPIELGSGRFSQKDFRAEIEELAGAFEVVRIEGEDYRHRRFEAAPGAEYFSEGAMLKRQAEQDGDRSILVPFDELLRGIADIHPIRYAALVDRIGSLYIEDIGRVERLSDALRWVHFIDSLYDSAVPMAASSNLLLGELFPNAFIRGPYGKKISRCLSRMEELLGEKGAS